MADELAEVGREIAGECGRVGLGVRVVVSAGNWPGRFVVKSEDGGWGVMFSGTRAHVIATGKELLRRRLGGILERAAPEGRAAYAAALERREREGVR